MKQNKMKVHSREWEHKLRFKCKFCGGRNCRRCSIHAALAKLDNPIQGLHCDWISNDFLAMMRPSNRIIQEFNIIKQFHQNGITAVFNVTVPGEHPYCGDGLVPSGFTYDPEYFMKENISFYNFGWKDMTAPTLSLMMDIVKVMVYEINFLKNKVAVHCHAGLGRTGLVIACTLIFLYNLNAEEAIALVRKARKGSIQTTAQVNFVHSFTNYVFQSKVIFPISGVHTIHSLSDMITLQSRRLHGREALQFRYVPQLVDVLCEKISFYGKKNAKALVVALACCSTKHLHTKEMTTECKSNFSNHVRSILGRSSCEVSVAPISTETQQDEQIRFIQHAVNTGDWSLIRNAGENDLPLLIKMLFLCLEQLEPPVLCPKILEKIFLSSENNVICGIHKISTIKKDQSKLFSCCENDHHPNPMDKKWKKINELPMENVRTIDRVLDCLRCVTDMDGQLFLLACTRVAISLMKMDANDVVRVTQFGEHLKTMVSEWTSPQVCLFNKKALDLVLENDLKIGRIKDDTNIVEDHKDTLILESDTNIVENHKDTFILESDTNIIEDHKDKPNLESDTNIIKNHKYTPNLESDTNIVEDHKDTPILESPIMGREGAEDNKRNVVEC